MSSRFLSSDEAVFAKTDDGESATRQESANDDRQKDLKGEQQEKAALDFATAEDLRATAEEAWQETGRRSRVALLQQQYREEVVIDDRHE